MADASDRDWRDSNAPQWAKDAAEAEIEQYRLTAALAWPTEARPSPVSFHWTEYDRLVGEPVAGTYYHARDGMIEISENDGRAGKTWKPWVFKGRSGDWSTQVKRGYLFRTKHDADLWRLWDECEKAAKTLLGFRKRHDP